MRKEPSAKTKDVSRFLKAYCKLSISLILPETLTFGPERFSITAVIGATFYLFPRFRRLKAERWRLSSFFTEEEGMRNTQLKPLGCINWRHAKDL